MRLRSTIWSLFSLSGGVFFFPYTSAFAEPLFKNPIKYNSLPQLLTDILQGITIVLIPVMTLAIVYIGFKMVLAGASKPEEFAKLKQSLFWALAGLFIVLAAGGILSVIETTLKQVLVEEAAVVPERGGNTV